jgi:hypothetical protein
MALIFLLGELDISCIDPNVPVHADVINALKRRIVEVNRFVSISQAHSDLFDVRSQLQDKLDAQDSSEPSAKRARKMPPGATATYDILPQSSAPTKAQEKAQEKQRKAVLKSIFDQ